MNNKAIVNYHIKSDEPQAFLFDVDGIIGNLVSPELVPTSVSLKDLRSDSLDLDFKTDGIAFESHASKVADFTKTTEWKAIYEAELEALLIDRIGARVVISFDHTIRIDDPQAERKPARNVHNDYTRNSAEQRLIDLVGIEKAKTFRDGHYGFVNIWRPIENVIRSSPLGFIHPDSMQPSDWMNIELIYPDRKGQILGVSENKAHQWFYKSYMDQNEVVIFNIYDNRGRPHLAHSALDLELPDETVTPRKSIESRTLVRYA